MEASEAVSLIRNPRMEILRAVTDMDLAWCLKKTAEIHGHFCPGSALGVMASVWGLERLGNKAIDSDGMEELMAIVEINACFADGIQVVSGCTLGNNALVYRDLGRMAVTFAVRREETGVRIRVRPDFKSTIDRLVPEFYPLMEKVIMNRAGLPEEEIAFKQAGKEAAFALLKRSFEDLFIAETVPADLPDYAPITASAVCAVCGETVMATKMTGPETARCRICGNGEYGQVEGAGIVIHNRKNLAYGHGREGRPGHRPSSFWMQDPQAVFADLKLRRNDILLDLGCGAGDYALAAAGRVPGGTVHALDRSESLIGKLKAEIGFRGIENVFARCADITAPLPLPDRTADVCLLATVLHIPTVKEKAGALFTEIRRVLKPTGRLAIMECKKEETAFGPPKQMRLSAEEVEGALTAFGFETIAVKDLGFNYMIQFRMAAA